MKYAAACPTLSFLLTHYRHFNARVTRDATLAYWKHIEAGGKMFWSLAGAMSTAQLGISLAPAIRAGLIHGISSTGANLEESLFRLIAHDHFEDFPDYRYFSKADDAKLELANLCRVTDTSIPEREAFKVVEPLILAMWERGTGAKGRRFWHEYFYELALTCAQVPGAVAGDRVEECWLLAAAECNLPIVVPGFEDSTFGNYLATQIIQSGIDGLQVRSGIEYMIAFLDQYATLSQGKGVGFFQIGGGIAGDFPICVVPTVNSMKLPGGKAKPWAYFCQISDSTTSYGSYSGATPNEKITWEKLLVDTPMFVIESDATIVAPLMLAALLEAKSDPDTANALIEAWAVEDATSTAA